MLGAFFGGEKGFPKWETPLVWALFELIKPSVRLTELVLSYPASPADVASQCEQPRAAFMARAVIFGSVLAGMGACR